MQWLRSWWMNWCMSVTVCVKSGTDALNSTISFKCSTFSPWPLSDSWLVFRGVQCYYLFECIEGFSVIFHDFMSKHDYCFSTMCLTTLLHFNLCNISVVRMSLTITLHDFTYHFSLYTVASKQINMFSCSFLTCNFESLNWGRGTGIKAAQQVKKRNGRPGGKKAFRNTGKCIHLHRRKNIMFSLSWGGTCHHGPLKGNHSLLVCREGHIFLLRPHTPSSSNCRVQLSQELFLWL